uniref:Transmembrane protein n=1 Tax=Trypanosoma congolense (strain IL3000) TaxID=1068625 RepID=G0UN51_TRYCI|nr:conserved hypothetical protein [Trypanosoma congolense IL3000]
MATAVEGSPLIKELCEARAVDAQLLHNSTEKVASETLKSAERCVTAGWALLGLTTASAAMAALFGSWQYRRVYRVWRLRNPQRVAHQRRVMWSSGGLSVASLLLLLSPIGPETWHTARLEDVRQLDAIAVRALVLKRRYEAVGNVMEAYNSCEEEWAALMRERIAINAKV